MNSYSIYQTEAGLITQARVDRKSRLSRIEEE